MHSRNSCQEESITCALGDMESTDKQAKTTVLTCQTFTSLLTRRLRKSGNKIPVLIGILLLFLVCEN